MDENQVTTAPVVEEVIDNSVPNGMEGLEDVISAISAEHASTDEAAVEGDAQTDATDETAAGEAGQADPAPEAEEDRGAERLVAREVEVRLKEEQLKTREAKVAEVEQENAALKEQLAAIPTDFIDQLRLRPLDALENAGHDPDHVVRLILAAKMKKQGKPVPSELQQAIDRAEFEHKQNQLDKRQKDFEQRMAMEQFAAKVEADARKYVTTGVSKDAPTVAQVAKANPERVFSEILDEIGRDARARAKEPGAQLITFDEASRRVEKRWSEMKSLFGVSPGTEASTTADTTKSTASAPGASKTKPTPKAPVPPKKPLTPPKPKTEAELLAEGLAEAEAEFRRAEQLRKQPRA